MDKQTSNEADFDALRWLTNVGDEDHAIQNDMDRKTFARECLRFVTRHNPAGSSRRIPGSLSPLEWKQGQKADRRNSWPDIVQGKLRYMLFQALYRQEIKLEWPEWRSLRWDDKASRYRESFDYSKDNIESEATRVFANLLLRYGHLITTCKAPAARKSGRRPKGARPEATHECGNVFLAKRKTGRYCSQKCKNRVLAQSKRKE